MTSFTSLPIGLTWAKYLGNEDRIVVAGRDVFNNAQFRILESINDASANDPQIYSHKYSTVAKAQIFKSNVNCCELGGMARLRKTFLLCGTHKQSSKESAISIGNIDSSFSDVSIELNELLKNESGAVYTSMSWNSDHESLAAADELGRVSVVSAEKGQVITSFIADAAGVGCVNYLRSGHILTSGKSLNSSQLKLWDLRMKTAVFDRDTPVQQYSQPQIRNEIGEYTCLTYHPSLDKIYCGSETGIISLWDIRASSAINFQQHTKKVTDIAVHPRLYDSILTSSIDGTIKYADTRNVSFSRDISRPTSLGDIENTPIYQSTPEIVVEEISGSAAMVCVDSSYGRDIHSESLGLAASSLGGLWTFKI